MGGVINIETKPSPQSYFEEVILKQMFFLYLDYTQLHLPLIVIPPGNWVEVLLKPGNLTHLWITFQSLISHVEFR